ncbi:MAG: DUF1579 family protein [Cyclobacteriaceae bacterium]
MKKALLFFTFFLTLLSSTIGQLSKSTADLSFILGEWMMKMTYNPDSDEPGVQEGTMCCGWVMDSTYIKCKYALERPSKKQALNDVYFNYNPLSKKFESMWMSSTWPVKVLLVGDMSNQNDTTILTTRAEFPIENNLTEHVRDVLTIENGSSRYIRKTYIRTSTETEWKYHSLEEAYRTSVEELANKDQISGKTWQALGPEFTTTIRETSQIYISSHLASEYELDKSIIQSFLRYTLSYTQDQLSVDKVMYRYPHYNRVEIEKDIQLLANAGIIKKSDSLFTTTTTGNQILSSYWDLRRRQIHYYDYLSDDQLQTLYTVMNKVITKARNLDNSYPNQSIQSRFLSRPRSFEDEHLAIKVSELLKEYTAFINDVSHYKYGIFPAQSFDERRSNLKLSPLAKELMSATRNGRNYDLNRCYNQSNWRQGQSGCDAAVDELIANELVSKKNEFIQQTSSATRLSEAVEAFADKRRYLAWKDVTISEYLEFKKILDWILNNPVESFVPYPERHRRLVQSIGFSPDQDTLYFALPQREYLEGQGREVKPESPRLAIYYATRTAESWGEPQPIDFGDFDGYNAYEPTLSSDGQLMIFNSHRQLDGSPVEDRGPNNLWYSEKRNGKWRKPKYLNNINSKEFTESYATLTRDGNLFYVQESKLDGASAFTIMSTRFDGEKTKKGKPIGLGYGIADPWVAPDGSYIIYTKYDPDDWVNTCDLYYSLRDGKEWTKPKLMPKINGKRSDYAVAISPDEQWFYYRRRGRFLKFPFQPLLEEMRGDK